MSIQNEPPRQGEGATARIVVGDIERAQAWYRGYLARRRGVGDNGWRLCDREEGRRESWQAGWYAADLTHDAWLDEVWRLACEHVLVRPDRGGDDG